MLRIKLVPFVEPSLSLNPVARRVYFAQNAGPTASDEIKPRRDQRVFRGRQGNGNGRSSRTSPYHRIQSIGQGVHDGDQDNEGNKGTIAVWELYIRTNGEYCDTRVEHRRSVLGIAVSKKLSPSPCV